MNPPVVRRDDSLFSNTLLSNRFPAAGVNAFFPDRHVGMPPGNNALDHIPEEYDPPESNDGTTRATSLPPPKHMRRNYLEIRSSKSAPSAIASAIGIGDSKFKVVSAYTQNELISAKQTRITFAFALGHPAETNFL